MPFEDKTPAGKGKRGLFYSLWARMLASFGALFVTAMVIMELALVYGVPFTDYTGEIKEYREEIFKDLNLIADLKKERLLRWVKERLDDSEVLARSESVRSNVSSLFAYMRAEDRGGLLDEGFWEGLKQKAFYNGLVSQLKLVKNTYAVYHEIEVADSATGIVVATTYEEDLGRNIADERYFKHVSTSGNTHVNIEREFDHGGLSTKGHQVSFHVSRLVQTSPEARRARAVLIMHVAPEDFTVPLLLAGGPLGRTGEALLVDQDAMILTSVKHPLPGGKAVVPFEFRCEGEPALLAAKGQEGIIEAKDYRGVPVLAAYRHLRITPEVGWGLIVKKDTQEVFSPLKKEITYFRAVGFFVILFALGVVYFLSLRLSRPIRSLSEASGKIAGGDLDARAEVTTSGEMGLLSETFNRMAEKVQNQRSDLEAEVNSRTEELNLEIKERMRREAEVSGLLKGARALLEHSNFADAARDIFDACKSLTGAGAGFVAILSQDGSQYEVVHFDGGDMQCLLDPELPMSIRNMKGEAYKTGSTVFDNNFAKSKWARFMPKGHVDLKCVLFAPLKVEGRVQGILGLANKPGGFTDKDAQIASAFAELAAVALSGSMHVQRLEFSEKRLRTLAALAPVGIYMTDADGAGLYANRLWCEMSGLSPDDNTTGQGWTAGLHKDDRDWVSLRWRNMVETKGKLEHEYRFETAPGKVTWVYGVASPLFDARGHVTGYIGVNLDITERKLVEQEKVKSQKLESLGVLAGGIAHDFNNLLQSLFFDVSLAKLFATDNEKSKHMLEKTERNLTRAMHLSKQLVTFAKGGAPEKTTLDLSPLIRDSVKFALSGSNIKGEVSVQEGLWPVQADQTQINQVIHNIVLNAGQAMPGGGLLKVRAKNSTLRHAEVGSLQGGRYLAIEFQDHGHGIDEETLPKVFDPFFTTREKGSGLGLATSYSIVKRHGGLLSVVSSPGAGATFTMYLPASGGKGAKKEIGPDEPLVAGEGRILVMDDDPEITASCGTLLETLGYEFEAAADGQEAVRKYQDAKASGRPFDAVILDLTVQGGTGGKQALKMLLETDPGVKAIVSSGYSDEMVADDFKRHGFRASLAKPYTVETISRVLHDVLTEGQ